MKHKRKIDLMEVFVVFLNILTIILFIVAYFILKHYEKGLISMLVFILGMGVKILANYLS